MDAPGLEFHGDLAEDVDLVLPAQRVEGDKLQGSGDADAGVVDQDVEVADRVAVSAI
ncbi:hypothetical protein [Nonomuraea turcica]|uniref:hypothetical protein n=1 Tax=Nonomuraea sp. G32 TaxID=3067274 RepID=UPI00273C82BE|nr:hypothetical protein [Nonomuraea sp. G32]MDP4511236.1 hypothetical protein [Nonomuraea sp. G32]